MEHQTFADLGVSEVVASELAKREITQPFAVQKMVLPDVLAGHDVLAQSPTGSGKTLVAAYAVHRALAAHGKAFYTTPLKALSNQKYGELCTLYGERRVGLLTGDVSLNANADVVVMTTEVLRNMLLTESHQLDSLGLVVLDEVHYLQDPFRGGVWEEVIILTPAAVRFVALSATIGNANFIGEWFAEVRGPTAIIVESERPIQLHNHLAVMRRGQAAVEIVDLLDGELHVLFEGSRRSVDAQLASLGGEEADRWAEIRARQQTLPGRRRWDGEPAPLVRPGPRVSRPASFGPSTSITADRATGSLRNIGRRAVEVLVCVAPGLWRRKSAARPATKG